MLLSVCLSVCVFMYVFVNVIFLPSGNPNIPAYHGTTFRVGTAPREDIQRWCKFCLHLL